MGVQPYSFPKANFLHSIRTEKQCCRKHMKPIPTSRPIYNHMQSLLVTTQLHALNKHIILCLTGESPISCWRQALLTPMKLHCSPIRKNAHNFSLLAPCNTCTQTNVKKYSKYIYTHTNTAVLALPFLFDVLSSQWIDSFPYLFKFLFISPKGI